MSGGGMIRAGWLFLLVELLVIAVCLLAARLLDRHAPRDRVPESSARDSAPLARNRTVRSFVDGE